jgi:predicted  nucleic acid-binding Zn-ribbon protein
LEDVVKAQEKKLQTRPETLVKLIGPDYKVLVEMSMEVEKYKTQIEEAQQKSQKLTDEQKKQELQNQIQQMQQTQSNLEQKIQEYNDEFSVYKWILETIQW